TLLAGRGGVACDDLGELVEMRPERLPPPRALEELDQLSLHLDLVRVALEDRLQALAGLVEVADPVLVELGRLAEAAAAVVAVRLQEAGAPQVIGRFRPVTTLTERPRDSLVRRRVRRIERQSQLERDQRSRIVAAPSVDARDALMHVRSRPVVGRVLEQAV